MGKESDGDVRSGLLQCQSVDCRRNYPIIFGCPILVPDIEGWLTANLQLVLQQQIQDPQVENLISEIISPDIAFNIMRQQQSSYCQDHYKEEFSDYSDSDQNNSKISTVRSYLNQAIDLMPNNSLPCIDVGCAVGGTTFDIAKKRQAPTLGIDLNWPLLNIARNILENSVISYPHRIIGNRYERRETKAFYPSLELCDFWIADATCLPFEEDKFGLAVALNILDCLPASQEFLIGLLRIVKNDCGLVISCPFDWTSHTTNQKNWIYGSPALDKIFNDIRLASLNGQEKYFIFKSEPTETEWTLQLHKYSKINYSTRIYSLAVASTN